MNERLLLTVGGRADRSSNNSNTKKLFFYPEGLRVASGVPSWPRVLIDELKLRAAFGQSGNEPLYGQKFTELGRQYRGLADPSSGISSHHG